MTEPEQPVVAVPLRAALEHVWRARMAVSHALQNGPDKGELLDLLVEALAEIDKANEAAALAVEAVRPETDIDDAWKEAEAALGEYWRVRSLTDIGPKWETVATDGHRIASAAGPTPVAALRALASKLRAATGNVNARDTDFLDVTDWHSPPPSRPRGVVVIGLVLLALGIAVAVYLVMR